MTASPVHHQYFHYAHKYFTYTTHTTPFYLQTALEVSVWTSKNCAPLKIQLIFSTTVHQPQTPKQVQGASCTCCYSDSDILSFRKTWQQTVKNYVSGRNASSDSRHKFKFLFEDLWSLQSKTCRQIQERYSILQFVEGRKKKDWLKI